MIRDGILEGRERVETTGESYMLEFRKGFSSSRCGRKARWWENRRASHGQKNKVGAGKCKGYCKGFSG